MNEPKTAVNTLLAKVEKKPWPSRAKKYSKKKESSVINKIAFIQGYLAKRATVDVANEYNPSAAVTGNTCWPTKYVSPAKDPINPGKDIDQCSAAQGDLEKNQMEEATDNMGDTAGNNELDIPSQIQLPFSKKIVNINQGAKEGIPGGIAQNEWQDKNQRSEGKQMNFDPEEKAQQNPTGIDKINKEEVKSVGEIAEAGNKPILEVAKQLQMGQEIEKEHTDSPKRALNIAKQHEGEFSGKPYYTELKKMEEKINKMAMQKMSAIQTSNVSDSGVDQSQPDSIHRNTFVEKDLTHQSDSIEQEQASTHPHEGLTFAKIKALNVK
jgi:hypothetical protein